MSQVLYINILVDWSLSDIMTSKLVIRESESPRPAASSILISRMTSSSVIIPYGMQRVSRLYTPPIPIGENISTPMKSNVPRQGTNVVSKETREGNFLFSFFCLSTFLNFYVFHSVRDNYRGTLHS